MCVCGAHAQARRPPQLQRRAAQTRPQSRAGSRRVQDIKSRLQHLQASERAGRRTRASQTNNAIEDYVSTGKRKCSKIARHIRNRQASKASKASNPSRASLAKRHTHTRARKYRGQRVTKRKRDQNDAKQQLDYTLLIAPEKQRVAAIWTTTTSTRETLTPCRTWWSVRKPN